jgi:hypothetical protein
VGALVKGGQVAASEALDLLKKLAACSSDFTAYVICASEQMMRAPFGHKVRDAINAPISAAIREYGETIGSCSNEGNLVVCIVPEKIRVSGSISIPGVGSIDLSVVFPTGFDWGGTTVGDVYLTSNKEILKGKYNDKLGHELIHTYQWAAAGGLGYIPLYIGESAASKMATGHYACANRFEIAADLADGGYLGPNGSCS